MAKSDKITIKSPQQIELMKKSGAIAAKTIKKVLGEIKPGISLKQLEWTAQEEIKRLGAEVAFDKVPGYYWATCLTVNQEIVHGIPRDIILKEGDKVSVDLGAVYQGWFSDVAWSVIVGGGSSKFLEVGERALWSAIDRAQVGNHIGDIGACIEEIVEGAGYKVIHSLIGHGVGKELHEAPEVPGYGEAGSGPILKEGMTIAIEVIYSESSHEVVIASDNWTLVSADGSLGGLFEMTVAITKNGPQVLTDWRSFRF